MRNQTLNHVANQLIEAYPSPGMFLEFLCDALNWANQYPQPDQEKNGIYFVTQLIDLIVKPWSACQSPEQAKKALVLALQRFSEDFGSPYFYEQLAYISRAQIHDATRGGEYTAEHAKKIILNMQMLFTIGSALLEYERHRAKAA